MWLEKDFQPASAVCNRSGKHHLLILDGHNSHSTYGFCKFAHDHNILVICLPSHTTHALQPCDIAVFGPLAASWKAEVNQASHEYIPIHKSNLVEYYARAREHALQPSTILSAFSRTGIWPLNPNIIDPIQFQPSLNTTTEAAQPMPAQIPALLVPILKENISCGQSIPSHASAEEGTQPSVHPANSNSIFDSPMGSSLTTTTLETQASLPNPPPNPPHQQFQIVGLPPVPQPAASHAALQAEN